MTHENNSLFDKLVILNSVYNNTIVKSKIVPQASVIKTQLFPHQSILVNGMHIYRDKMTRGYLLGNQAINGKIGILGDKGGSGKTLSVLAYLASQISTFPRMTCELTNNSSKYFFSHEIYSVSDISSSNLIIVPHCLFTQWKQEIIKHTTMSYVSIETKRMIKEDTAKNIVNSNFVLTTNRCYKLVQEYATQNGIHWNNVFIDEASSIYINSSDPPLRFQFLWLITNNWIPLLFKNPIISKNSLSYVKDNRLEVHPDLEEWLAEDSLLHYESTLISSVYLKEYLPFNHINRGSIVLRCSNELINSSMPLPCTMFENIQCRPNINFNSLTSYYLARNIEPNITSEKIPHLFQALGIQFKNIDEYLELQPQIKHNLICRKSEENECIICLEQTELPTIVNCCYNLYCAKCLLKNTILNQKCPTCREVLFPENICCLYNLTENQIINSRNKTDVCINLFKENKHGKFLIYSSFDNIYYQMFEEIDKIGLKAERLENNLFAMLKTIKNFQEGNTQILFISNVDLIRGFSLPFISHLIFYHELSVYELKQALINSAQRIGRNSSLKIIQLNSDIQV